MEKTRTRACPEMATTLMRTHCFACCAPRSIRHTLRTFRWMADVQASAADGQEDTGHPRLDELHVQLACLRAEMVAMRAELAAIKKDLLMVRQGVGVLLARRA